ncbi:MAG: hypothetical protein WAU86_00470, partial [Oricola sp.]
MRAGRSVVLLGFSGAFRTLPGLGAMCAGRSNACVYAGFRTLRSDPMADDREFRIRPGRIRSTR